ncbi:MAG: N-acetyl-gamma-glutamyl-phosphate reductase [Chloroflexi bacterium]|nr:N-acetyl-gamma-glutamyl-phosphate reductase [Chloroflexota bacterium]MDL1884099.1 N-acetyl-gamma-glutamyl-phosphate reductase [Anaerolineae bacterium CFX8]
MIRAGIVGASGYAGGELLRLLLGHPDVEVVQAASQSSMGKFLHQVHPQLRGRTSLRFISPDALQPCDVLFLALPHGEAQTHIEQYTALAGTIIDLSADFRLRDPAAHAATYGDHAAPDWLPRFAYGLPEINRPALRETRYASGVGCNAAATILALGAVFNAGWLDAGQPIIADIKVGSSEAGRQPNESSHHPARAGVVRPFQLTGHRHEAEVRQAFAGKLAGVRLSVTSVEMVRGVSAAVHVTLPPGLAERDLWNAYRAAWNGEPFVRIVHEKTGIHRHPEPRLLAGTNYADVGWEYDPDTGRAVLLCALDNLGKGAAGTAVQCMNLICGFDETSGLSFGGFYP